MLQRKPRPYDLIAMSLRVAWSDVVTEPLPDHLRRLLEKLADEETEQACGRGKRTTNASKRHHH